MPEISVIIPTFNRKNSLAEVLKKLENQNFQGKFEIIIVNDWSTDWTWEFLENYSAKNFELKILFQENKKQWIARNFWVKNAKSDLILFLQDDIFPEKNLISEHFNFHKSNFDEKIVVIWKTEWLKNFIDEKIFFEDWKNNWISKKIFLEQKKFYQFLDWSWKNFSDKIFWEFFNAPLFNYEELENRKNSKKISNNIFEINSEKNFFHFYTNNLSMKKNFFLKSLWFDEKFNSYWWEDIEFWYRLKKSWMKLFFSKNALAEHNHKYDLEKFLKREKKVSENLWKFLEIQPDLKNFFLPVSNFCKDNNLKFILKKILFKIFSSKIFLFFGKIFWKNFYWYFLGKKEFLKNFK